MNITQQTLKIKSGFIYAAKEIIETKGKAHTSARNIAKIAGYSYATIYNYFNDLDELLLHCRSEYLNDFSDYITNKLIVYSSTLDTVTDLFEHYIDYTLLHPNKYLLIYDPTLGHAIKSTKSIDGEEIFNVLGILFNRYLSDFFSSSGIIESTHSDLYDIIMSYLYGKIYNYLINPQSTSESFKEDVLNQLDILMTSFL